MRLNKFIAQSTSFSRRKADQLIADGQVSINDKTASVGDQVSEGDIVLLDGRKLAPKQSANGNEHIFMLNKPVGYVCSRDGQGSPSIYELVPPEYQDWQIAGRLDKDSSGLVVLTDDGGLLNQLTHPSFGKQKVYQIQTQYPLSEENLRQINEQGVDIGDKRLSKMQIQPLAVHRSSFTVPRSYEVRLAEGRNRQIRRTIAALTDQKAPPNKVLKLHRTQIGKYKI